MKPTPRVVFYNATRNTVIADSGWIAASPLQRMKGLLGLPNLEPGTGLLLRPGSCIHMRGMKFAIDVIFLDRQFNVVKIVKDLRPEPRWKIWKMTGGGWRAHSCIELPVGAIDRSMTESGDVIKIRSGPESNVFLED